jgi:hypothetical protein
MCVSSSSAQEILLTDRQCVEFLQWALPQLGLRWPGFRKVRGQVHKRIVRRLRELELTHIAEYRRYLADHPAEWTVLDACLRISISRFYRDRDVFDHLRDSVLPDLARAAQQRGENRLIVWSAGCASGEEPYTVADLDQPRAAGIPGPDASRAGHRCRRNHAPARRASPLSGQQCEGRSRRLEAECVCCARRRVPA